VRGTTLKNAVGAVAVISGVAAALRFQSINILGIDLRAEVAGDVGVGNRNAVNQPAHLVSAANVELVVREISTGDVVGDHREAIGARGARRFLNLQAVDESRRCYGLGLRGVRGDKHCLALCRKAQLKMQNRCGTGKHRGALLVRHEIHIRDRDHVFAEGNRIEVKLPGVVRAGV